MQQYVLQYVQVTMRQKWPSFFFFFGGTKFYAYSTINIIHELHSTRQNFDVWIGVAFLSDNATKPVERAPLGNAAADSDVEFLSKFIREFDTAEMRRMTKKKFC